MYCPPVLVTSYACIMHAETGQASALTATRPNDQEKKQKQSRQKAEGVGREHGTSNSPRFTDIITVIQKKPHVRKIFLPAIPWPKMAAPILWAPGMFWFSQAWEEESPGRSPKSMKKVSKKSSDPRAPQSLKKVSGRVQKVSRKSKNGVFETFRTFVEIFPDFWGERVRGLFRDFFHTFGASAQRLLPAGEILNLLQYRAIWGH